MSKNYLIPIVIIMAGALIGAWLVFSGGGERGSLTSTIQSESTTQSESTSQSNVRELKLSIEGMFCAGCEAGIEGSLNQLPGVLKVEADAGGDSGRVIYNPNKISQQEILAAPIFKVYSAKIISDNKY